MKILILDAYYRRFLKQFYETHPETAALDFENHRGSLMRARFGTSDAYSDGLRELGFESQEIVTNDDRLQWKWAVENGVRAVRLPSRLNLVLNKAVGLDWRYRVIVEQVRTIRPDVLYVQEDNILTDALLVELKKNCRLLVGQVASPIPGRRTYRAYDLVLTSFPHFVQEFSRQGIKSRYFRLAFDARVLDELPAAPTRSFACTFVGGISRAHTNRVALLERLAQSLDIDFFGYCQGLPAQSPVLRRHHGEVWALDMYRALASSQITINNHIDVAGRFANNMRLYEATGVGACLVTDVKENLHELFKPDIEIVGYAGVEELVEKVRYLLTHEAERAAIARSGQERTLREHTYRHRMQELMAILGEEI